MQLTFYSFMMAIITNSLIITAMYFLRKNKYFAQSFGVEFMAILYAFCVARVFVPLEFPAIQTIIRDELVYAAIMDVLQNRAPITSGLPFDALYILIALWVAVAAILFIRFAYKQKKYMKYIKAQQNFATEEEKRILSAVSSEVFGKAKDLLLIKTNAVSTAMVMGLRKSIVILPDFTYSEDELKMIFTHECTHLKNRDLWLKLLVQIYCCVFWWNPFAYLLKIDLGNTLELKCDLKVVKTFSEDERLSYFETILNSIKKAKGKMPSAYLVSSGFSASAKNEALKQRFKNVVEEKPNKKKQIALISIVAVCFAALYAASYVFIWQPVYFDLPEEEYEQADNGLVSDETNAYLVEQEDGNYLFYFEGFDDPYPVTKEEVEQGLYAGYPIK